MPALRDFIKRLGTLDESICSQCCQIVRVSKEGQELREAETQHVCGEFSLNTIRRGEYAGL